MVKYKTQGEILIPPFDVKFVDIKEGLSLAYSETGVENENQVVFIHGLANYSQVWNYQLNGLQKNNHCIAIDLPGNGLSTASEYPYGMVFYAECVHEFCKKLGLNKVTLVGHSMGGQIAALLCLRYPETYAKLVLVASAGLESFSGLDKMFIQNSLNWGEYFYTDAYHIKQAITEGFFINRPEKNKIIEDLVQLLQKADAIQWRQMIVKSIQSMLETNLMDFLAQLTMPVTIIYGEHDALIPNKMLHPALTIQFMVKQVEKLLPHCKTHILAQSGHFVQIENWELVNNILEEKK